MSKQANPTLIGAFLLGGLALILGGVVLFGSGKIFKDSEQYVLFFDGDVAGLNIGAPVTFRGVKVGSVAQVLLHFDPKDLSLRIPVIIKIDHETVRNIARTENLDGMDDILQDFIKRGLRAKLKLQSFVTGQLNIEFDFYPDKAARFVAPTLSNNTIMLTELPTIPSDIEELRKTLKDLPIEKMISKAISALEGIERVVNSPKMMEAIDSLDDSLEEIESLSRTVNDGIPELIRHVEHAATELRELLKSADDTVVDTRRQIDGVAGELLIAIKDFRTLVDDAGDLVTTLEKRAVGLSDDIKTAAGNADQALTQAEKTLKAFEGITAKDSAMGYRLLTMLDELTAAARSVRVVAEYLERHPEALLRGKEGR